MAHYNTTSRIVDGKQVPGIYLQAFIKNGDHFFATEIKVYQDSMIDCWGLETVEGFKEKVRQGWVRTSLPDGALVSMMVSSINFTVSHVSGGVKPAEFIKEVLDEIEELNGRPTSLNRCRAALETYKKNKSEKHKELVAATYEAVPEHNRCFLGDMDTGDFEYRRILGLPR